MTTPLIRAEWDHLATVAVVRPKYFRVAEPVNDAQRRWYAGQARPARESLGRQHAAVSKVLVERGIRLVYLPAAPDCPLQFNVRDAATVVGSTVILGRLTPAVRQREPEIVADSFPRAVRPAAGYLEGGDILVTPDEVFVGLSQRTDRRGLDAFAAIVGDARRITPVPLAGALHLDIALSLLGAELGLVHLPSLTGPLPASLAGIDLIEVTDEEFGEQAVNVLPLGPRSVVMDARHDRLRQALEHRGFRCVQVDLEDITKVGGGIRCMTLPLQRMPPDRPTYDRSKP